MDKQFFKGEFPGGSYEMGLVNSDLDAKVTYTLPEFEGSLEVKVKSKAGLEKLKQIIPGTIDDAIISVVEAALGV